MIGKIGEKTMLEKEIDGVPHVIVPKEMWEKMWDILDRLEKIGK